MWTGLILHRTGNTAVNPRVLQNARNFSSWGGPFSFYRRTLLYGVSKLVLHSFGNWRRCVLKRQRKQLLYRFIETLSYSISLMESYYVTVRMRWWPAAVLHSDLTVHALVLNKSEQKEGQLTFKCDITAERKHWSIMTELSFLIGQTFSV